MPRRRLNHALRHLPGPRWPTRRRRRCRATTASSTSSHPACAALLGGTPPSVDAFVEQGLQAGSQRLGERRFRRRALRPLGERAAAGAAAARQDRRRRVQLHRRAGRARHGAPAEPVTVRARRQHRHRPGRADRAAARRRQRRLRGRTRGRDRPARAARQPRATRCAYVAGYTAHNDVSGSEPGQGRRRQLRARQEPAGARRRSGPGWSRPTSCPTRTRVGIRLDIDGRPLQDGSTRDDAVRHRRR